MIAPARIAAYEILMAISSGRADLPTAIAFARDGLHDDRDRALAAEIATGVQRWRAACDHLIAAANENGGADNITVVVVKVTGGWWHQLINGVGSHLKRK